MTFGPYGGAFTGRPFVPGDEPASAPRPSIAYAAATQGGAGTLRASFAPPTSGRAWLVRRLTLTCTSNTSARVYVGDPNDPSALTSGTDNGAFDENESVVGYFVPEATQLSVEWTNVNPALDRAGVRIEYVEL